MTKQIKPKLDIRYNPLKNTKENVVQSVKNEIKQIYNELRRKKVLNKDLLDTFLQLDIEKDGEFRLLFLYSLFCSYYHAHKGEIDPKKIIFPLNQCYKKNGFIILASDDIHNDILKDISMYFNTDANNLMPITGKILEDLNNIEIKFNKFK